MSENTRLWRRAGFAEDAWRIVGPEEDIPAEEKVIVPAARLGGIAAEARLAPTGALLGAGEPVDLLVPYLAGLELVALYFPRFSDGRSFSKAEILRRRHGFAGEIRAVGDVILDQIPLMLRCGFDAFLIRHQPTLGSLEKGEMPAIDLYYQPARGEESPAAGRSWVRRPAIRDAAETA